MNQNHHTIERFYQAFQKKDWKTMQACYHPQSNFHDPVFKNLTHQKTLAMWHMLCNSATDLTINYSDVVCDDQQGSCRWEARYTFSRSGRKVHNIIHAEFRFKDNLIIQHRDHFNFWRWSSMALGLPGKLLGWTPFLQEKVSSQARRNLYKFIENDSLYRNLEP